MKEKKKRSLIISGLILICVVGIVFWWQGNRRHGKYHDLLSAFYVMGYLKLNYYQPLSVKPLFKAYWEKGSIAEMLEVLDDPYTRFFTREQYIELNKDTKGVFGGIGVYLVPKKESLIISEIVANSPGARGGLQKGDRIIKIDGQLIKELTPEVALAKIRGRAGSPVLLGILRQQALEERQLEFKIIRQKISLPTVKLEFRQDPQFGCYAYLRIFQFADNTPVYLRKKLNLIDQKVNCQALLLDLRSNPGGSLEAAVAVTSEFLPKGTPVLHIKRRNLPLQTLLSRNQKVSRRLPIVVLVDKYSASAAEILAGALKDQKIALLVGTATFGKDLIQEIQELPGGTAFTVTIARYLTSGKIKIHQKGIRPHRIVAIPQAFTKLLNGNPEEYMKLQELQEKEAVQFLRQEIKRFKTTKTLLRATNF